MLSLCVSKNKRQIRIGTCKSRRCYLTCDVARHPVPRLKGAEEEVGGSAPFFRLPHLGTIMTFKNKASAHDSVRAAKVVWNAVVNA